MVYYLTAFNNRNVCHSFGNIAKLSTDGAPKIVFYLAGVTIWSYFSDTLTKNSQCFYYQCQHLWEGLFPKAYNAIIIGIFHFD
jgi:lipopolysaccharide transport system permease protein